MLESFGLHEITGHSHHEHSIETVSIVQYREGLCLLSRLEESSKISEICYAIMIDGVYGESHMYCV